jgi:hypothetical protein
MTKLALTLVSYFLMAAVAGAAEYPSKTPAWSDSRAVACGGTRIAPAMYASILVTNEIWTTDVQNVHATI